MKTYPLPIHVQRFFTDRLGTQLRASPNTIISYRDTFRLLLKYAAAQLQKAPTDLRVADVNAELVGMFLADIESTRGNGARSRNTRNGIDSGTETTPFTKSPCASPDGVSRNR